MFKSVAKNGSAVIDFFKSEVSAGDVKPKMKVFFFVKEYGQSVGGLSIRFASFYLQVNGNDILWSFQRKHNEMQMNHTDIHLFSDYANLFRSLTSMFDVTFIGDKQHAAWLDTACQKAMLFKAGYVEANRSIPVMIMDDVDSSSFVMCLHSTSVAYKRQEQLHKLLDLPTLLQLKTGADYEVVIQQMDTCLYSDCENLGIADTGDEKNAIVKAWALKELYDKINQ